MENHLLIQASVIVMELLKGVKSCDDADLTAEHLVIVLLRLFGAAVRGGELVGVFLVFEVAVDLVLDGDVLRSLTVGDVF